MTTAPSGWVRLGSPADARGEDASASSQVA